MDTKWSALGTAAAYMRTDGLELRDYQSNIIRSALHRGNTLVVLPTGLGKTLIGAAVIADALSRGRKAAFLAPTRPLAEQHHATLSGLLRLSGDELLLLVGSVSKNKRAALEKSARVIVATPQTLSNDLKGALLSLDEFGCVVFDECHRAVGKYAYTYIANECSVRDVLVLGLTASPGSKKEKVNALIEALGIRHIEVRISSDPDVARYVMQKNLHIIDVELNDTIKRISLLIRPEAEAALRSLNRTGLLHFKNFDNIPKGRLLQAGGEISRISSDYKFAAMYSYVKLLNVSHAYDLLRSEGLHPFITYMESLQNREKKSRGVENLLASENIRRATDLAVEAVRLGEEHSKVFAVLDILNKYKGIIVFAQYRSTVKMLVDFITNSGFRARAFVGKKEGITQEMQKSTIQDFRDRKFDVLVASSIGEEGLDIPSVDAVIFYEPIPNEIRNIQRRGRTGRLREGEVYILSAIGTKDEVYMRVSRQKESKMASLIKSVNRSLESRAAADFSDKRQRTL
jgi:Fanconi anemia group M protein